MSNAAIVNSPEEQLRGNIQEELFSPQPDSYHEFMARAERPLRRPTLAPEYFDDVQPPLLSENHLRNSRLLPSREDLASRLPTGGCYAAVGAKTGAIAGHLLPLVNPGRLYICDTDLTSLDSGPLRSELSQQLIELHQDRVEAQWRRLPNGAFDFVFVNPDHDYARTMHSLQEAARKINDHGLIACANYGAYSPLEGIKYGVSRAVNEFCHQTRFEILYLVLRPIGLPDVVLAQKAPRKTDLLGGASLDAPDANSFMPEIWEYLIQKYGVQSVLDVGAGAGWSTKWFVEKNLCTLGIEGWREALDKSRCRSNVVEHDYTEGPFVPACRFDLAWCAGFVEHVEERFVPNFMGTFQSCKYVCLTHAEPSQAGNHHVNCQSTEYWINKMKEYGFDHDPGETFHLRSMSKQNSSNGHRHLAFFVRHDDSK